MKNNLIRKAILLLVFLVAVTNNSYSQEKKFLGTWRGSMDEGSKLLHMNLFIETRVGKLAAEIESADQDRTKTPVSKISIKGDSIFLTLDDYDVSYKGQMKGLYDIEGSFTQGNESFPLKLKRVFDYIPDDRPQTPRPPFDYQIRDVVYFNKDKSIQYGATITVPNGKGPFPAVLLITGSGQENRDEELFDHKPFAVLADYLTKKGYIVMRVDDRDIGQSTGNYENSTTADFVKDVQVSFDYLKDVKEVDRKKIGLLGHSEGGLIAEMTAAQRKDVDFIILFSGPGLPTIDVMTKQNELLLQKREMKQEHIDQYMKLYRGIVKTLFVTDDTTKLKKLIEDTVHEWVKNTPADIVKATTKIDDTARERRFADRFYEQLKSPWFQYFMRSDPQPYLEKIRCKVLAIGGDKDIQIEASSNLEGIKQSLAKSRSKDYETKELPGLNHLFQKCDKCTTREYLEIEETIDPSALDVISTWLDGHVKNKK